MTLLVISALLVGVITIELALRRIWLRLPEPSRYCQAMYGPKIKRMQALASGPPVDIVILGHSATAIGFDPNIVLEHLPEGTTCFNAAVGLANTQIQERFLPDYVLPLLRPKLVIVGTNSGALSAWDPTYRERDYDKAWATSKTTYGKIRRAVTSRSRLLNALECCIRDSDYRAALWRRAKRKNGMSASQRVDHYITPLGHRVPLRPVSDEAQLDSIDSKNEETIYMLATYKTDSWLRLRTLVENQPNTRFAGLMMPNSPRRISRKEHGIDDHNRGRADWAKFCDEHEISSIDIDDGSYTDAEYGDLDHPLWPAVRRQSDSLGNAIADNWEELMGSRQ